MRGGRGRKAQLQPGRFHRPGNQARVQRTAAYPAKQRLCRGQIKRDKGCIAGHGSARRRDDRDQPCLAALAGDAQHLGQRACRAGQPQRFGNPQATAIKQCHDGGIAGGDPIFAGLGFHAVDHVARTVLGQGAGQGPAVLRPARRQDRGGIHAVTLCQPTRETLDGGECARKRPRPKAARTLMRHPGAQIGLGHAQQGCGAFGRAAMAGQKIQIARDIGGIGCDRMGGCPVQRPDMGQPLRQRGPLTRADRRQAAIGGHDSQRRIARSNTPPKKPSRSVPCAALKRCGSPAPRARRPGRRPTPKSSRSRASDRIESESTP